MEDYIWGLIIIGITVIWGIVSWIINTVSNSKKYLELKPKLDNLESSIKEHESKVGKDRAVWLLKAEKWNEKIKNDKEEVQKIAKQKSMGFPWLAEAYAEYFSLKDLQMEKYLENKKHPAYTTAEIVRNIKNEKRELVKENKVVKYKITYFEKLFPWLSELIAEDEDEYIPVRIYTDTADDDMEDEDDEAGVKKYLTPEEYKNLPSVERNQMALDRYIESRNKSKWDIGRDYEMYVGYLYEQKGYFVEYKGIIDGFDDLGRDIIATKDNEVCIIQCKYWAQWKEMRENSIFQLFGTTMEYWIRNFRNYSKPKSFEEFAKFLNENKLRPIFLPQHLCLIKQKKWRMH